MIQEQELDIIGAMLCAVREVVGARLAPDEERKIEAALRNAWGGQDVYVKKKNDIDADARALDIRARYNMCNRRELQAEYGLSRTHFYKILKGG